MLSPCQNLVVGLRFYVRYCTSTAAQYPGPKVSRVRATSTYVRYASTTPYIPTPQQRLADLQQLQKTINTDKIINEMEREGRAVVAAATTAKKEEDVQVKLTKALEEELRVQQAALRRTTELDSYIQKHGYTVTTHDTSYRWIRTIDEYHVTITSNVGLPDTIHVKITKPGKGSNSIPAFVMELSLALNIDHVSVTDSHHPHPLTLMPAPHRSLQPYSTTATGTATATATAIPTPTPPVAAASTPSQAQPGSNQYQGWMCDCCGTASTSYSYHCQRGCEYDLLPSCITSIPDVSCTPSISTCQIKNMSAHQTTDIPLESFSEDVQKRFHVFLESVGIDQQLARHVWLYSHEKKFASPTQATTTAKKVETLTALKNFFSQ